MKLILETWKRFENTIEIQDYRPVILFENNQRTEIDFITLIERKDLSDSSLSKILSESFDLELEEILKEGLLSKVGDFFSSTAMKAKALIERGKLQGLLLLNKLKDGLASMQKSHPKLFKIGIIVLTAIAAYFLMDILTGSEAHAAISDMDQDSLRLVAGSLETLSSEAMQQGNMEAGKALQTAIKGLQQAHQMEDEMKFSQYIDSIKGVSEDAHTALTHAMEMGREVAREAGAGDEDSRTFLTKILRLGKLVLSSQP